MKRIAALIMGFVLMPVLVAPASAKELVVAHDTNFMPFEFKGPDGKFTGFDIELWETIAKKLGLSYKFQPMDFNGIIPGLQTGNIDAAIAAMSIVNRFMMFINSAIIGFGQGFQPVCGFNYGAKLFKRVQEGFWFCVKFCTSVLLVAAVCGWIFSPNLIGIFLKTDPLVIEYGSQALRLQALTFPLVGWITIANMMLQTIGKTVKASLLAMSRQFLFFVPVILTLPGFLGILGVQFSQPIADFCSFLLAVPLSISVLREMSHEQEQLEQLKITREN